MLGSGPDGDRKVNGQSPAAGTLAEPGSAVTVTVAEGPDPVAESIPWWTIVTLLVLLVAVLLVWYALRVQRAKEWVRAHVRVALGGTTDVGAQVEESRTIGSPITCVVRIEPHADNGTHVIQEVAR